VDSATFILLLVVPAGIAVVAAFLFANALRGRRVDDHPVCHMCGFDLFGKPADATRCAECGADLTRPRAMRVGRRERRRRVIAVALPVLLLCTAWLGLLGWGAARGTDWNRHKPGWWLMSQARGHDVAARDAALAEMSARLKAGKLSQRQIDALADLALDLQADPARPWSDVIGEAVGAARDAGKLPREKWLRYARQATVLQLTTRATLRRGDLLVAELTWAPPRVARGHLFYAELGPAELCVGSTRVGAHESVFRAAVSRDRGVGPLRIPIRLHPAEGVAALADGPHTLRCLVRYRIDEPRPPPASLVDEPAEVTAPFTLLPAGAATVRVTTDPALRPAVEKAVRLNNLYIDRTGRPGVALSLAGYVSADAPPTGLSFHVFVRTGGREWDLGAVNLPAGKSGSQWYGRELKDLPGFPGDATTVDVVLRPSPDHAVNSVELTEIWGVEVVRENVPVVTMRTPYR
jgi:hypothetical protein